MIQLNNVSVIKNKKNILKNVCWHVEKGEHWSILGLNGSGKTTLLNVLNGYLHPTTGQVKVFQQLFGKTYLPDLRKRIGLVSASLQQQIQPFESVLSIVLSGKFASIGLWESVEKSDIQLAEHYMELLQCNHLQDEEYGTLSQGERQKVLIARALMAQPELLIFDEPCNGLDIIMREHLLDLINDLSMQKDCPTMIYVTHHVEEVLPCFSHTLLLKNGEVFDQGLSEFLFTEDILSTFYDRPISIQKEQDRTWLALKEIVQHN